MPTRRTGSTGSEDELEVTSLIVKRLEILAQLHEAESQVSALKASLTRANAKLVENGVTLTAADGVASWW